MYIYCTILSLIIRKKIKEDHLHSEEKKEGGGGTNWMISPWWYLENPTRKNKNNKQYVQRITDINKRTNYIKYVQYLWEFRCYMKIYRTCIWL